MRVVVKNENEEFKIREFSMNRVRENYELEWKYLNADYFLVVISEISSAAEDMLSDDKLKFISAKFEELKRNEMYGFDDMRLILINKNKYIQKYKMLIPTNKLVAQGYKVVVYSCELEKSESDEEIMNIYKAVADEKSVMIPLSVSVSISKVKSFNIFNSKSEYKVIISKINNYIEGSLVYKISGKRLLYPITEEMLGIEMKILLNKDEQISVIGYDMYSKMYNITYRR